MSQTDRQFLETYRLKHHEDFLIKFRDFTGDNKPPTKSRVPHTLPITI